MVPRILIKKTNSYLIKCFTSHFASYILHHIVHRSVIKYQLHLISEGMSEREAYAKACNEFYDIRARQEVAERVAEEQALAFGAKRHLSQVEKALWLEQENVQKCPPRMTQILRFSS